MPVGFVLSKYRLPPTPVAVPSDCGILRHYTRVERPGKRLDSSL